MSKSKKSSKSSADSRMKESLAAAPDNSEYGEAGLDSSDAQQGQGPWSGNEHQLEVAAAREVGLNPTDAAVDSYTRAFQAGLTLDHPDDHAIVLLGRTVLRERQLKKALLPLLQFLRIPNKEIALRIFDGKFELRISAFAAETAKAATERAKLTLQIWLASGVLGYVAYQSFESVAAIIWGLGLVAGGLLLRNGLISGRARLAARLALGLAMLAQEEKLILPPTDVDDRK